MCSHTVARCSITPDAYAEAWTAKMTLTNFMASLYIVLWLASRLNWISELPREWWPDSKVYSHVRAVSTKIFDPACIVYRAGSIYVTVWRPSVDCWSVCLSHRSTAATPTVASGFVAERSAANAGSVTLTADGGGSIQNFFECSTHHSKHHLMFSYTEY